MQRRVRVVKMNMGMCEAVVLMFVNMYVRAPAQSARESVCAQPDNHQRDAELEPVCHTLRDRDAQCKHNGADDDERHSMPDAPQAADERRA